MRKHLLEGVKKGAFDEAEAEKRFNDWAKQQEEKIESKKSRLEKVADDDKMKRVEAEKKINETRSEELAKKNAEQAAKAAAAETSVEQETPVADVQADAVAPESTPEEKAPEQV